MIKKDYESYIILDGNFEDAQIEEIITKYENLFKKNNVEIKNIERIGRRRMAYPINKKQNGYYVCYEFVAATDAIEKIERAYKLDENIMRYLTVFMSKQTIALRDDHFRKKAAALALLEAEKAKAEAEAQAQAVQSEAAPEVNETEEKQTEK